MFTGINEDVCAFAWEVMVLPSLKPLAEFGLFERYAGCIVVVDPNSPEFKVLFSTTIGQPDDPIYTEIAMSKAQISHRTGLSTSVVQTQYPYRYQEGDTKWGGSTVDPGGLVVAFSGVQAAFDEMIAMWMAAAVRALCRHEMTRKNGMMQSSESFLGKGW